MRIGETRALGLKSAVAVAALFAAGAAAAQSAGAVPRASDGHPDLSGTWDNGAGIDFVQPRKDGKSICIFGCPGGAPPPESVPQASVPKYRPEFAARVADLDARQVQEDPVLRCFAPGVPRIGPPDKIVQRAGEAVFLYEDVSGSFFRLVPTDGRPHPTNNEPSFLGDAVGHWEGDTLVVETKNFNDQSWLTDNGAFHTDALRVVERLSRTADTLEWTATAYDPAVLAEPYTTAKRVAKLTDLEIVESPPCIDRSLANMVDSSHHTNPR
ncbi:MAG TPA: hypothetical protein VFL84_12900 [Gammaproteobacteria bacterium]|nr:hypothetical protein [Gammaproteobacteria bacterium]